MARILVYQYHANSALRDRVSDPEDSLPVPVQGQQIRRIGAQWNVASVTKVEKKTAEGRVTEYLVNLMPSL